MIHTERSCGGATLRGPKGVRMPAEKRSESEREALLDLMRTGRLTVGEPCLGSSRLPENEWMAKLGTPPERWIAWRARRRADS